MSAEASRLNSFSPFRAKRRLISIAHSYCVALNRRLADEMAAVGKDEWEVTAVAPSFFPGDLRPIWLERGENEVCQTEEVHVSFGNNPHLFYYRRRLRELLSQRWDLVHSWEEPYVLAAAEVAYFAKRRVPLILWSAQNLHKWYPPPFSLFERYSMMRCSAWMAAGVSTAKQMIARGYGKKPHRVMPLGVDVGSFRPDSTLKREAMHRMEWPLKGAPVIGYSGRLVPEKGIPLFLEVLSKVKSPWRALFVGGGPLEPMIRKWAERFDNRVRIVSNVAHSQVPLYLNAMDIMVAPSQTTPQWKEQFGRMLIEAFACGVPVIASDSGEIPHVVGESGIIVPEKDTAGLAYEIDRLLYDVSLRSELSCRGLARAHEKYAWPVVARAHLDFFSELLAA